MNSPYTTFTSTPSRRATLIGFGAFGIATLAGCAPSVKSVQNSPSNSSSSSSSSASSTSSPSDSTSPEEYAKFVADWNKYVGDINFRLKIKAVILPQPTPSLQRTFPNLILTRMPYARRPWKAHIRLLPLMRHHSFMRFLPEILNMRRNLAMKMIRIFDHNLTCIVTFITAVAGWKGTTSSAGFVIKGLR